MERIWPEQFKLKLNGDADPASIVTGTHCRFTVLTERMIRLEYSAEDCFEDQPTQVVWNRKFDVPEYRVSRDGDVIEIDTRYLHLYYDGKGFDRNHLYIDVKYDFTNYGGRWYYGTRTYGNPPREHNLKGTARTLDRFDGKWLEGSNPLEIPDTAGGKINREDGDADLGKGLLDTSGRTFFDDSRSLLLDEDGWVHPRRPGTVDLYFFGYGRNYFDAVHDFYRLSGPVPLLPRYALGNWWSRYWKYSEESYEALLRKFRACGIPFSVVVVDMDWHLVDIPEEYGKGWTGTTWNRDLFPDPERFLGWVKDHGYRISLNLHPADGVRAYEDQYEEMARFMGIDPASQKPVRFDFTDQAFIEAYFRFLMNPEEEKGVDFWWIDWQQGEVSAVEGLDPLWLLNHFHFYDLTRNGKRGLILSRYAGLGSHRYPLGFSGDTHATWESLQFQPYFTATAANVGYTWWSHDIGGHMNGIHDRELYIRWLQFGVFSPINRLHSSNNPFNAKEPWRYGQPYAEMAVSALRLRHALLPYLYTMNAHCHFDMVPVMVPVYYYDPMHTESYRVKNEYFFGTELLIQPMVHPTDPETGYTSERVWLPAGLWTDVWSGRIYDGGREGRYCILNRPITQQGVLAKAGAIVPFAGDGYGHDGSDTLDTGESLQNTANPSCLQIEVFPGADGNYTMYEDDGETFAYREGHFLRTHITSAWKENRELLITLVPEGDAGAVPEKRKITICLRGLCHAGTVESSHPISAREEDPGTRTIRLILEDVPSGQPLTFWIGDVQLPDRQALPDTDMIFDVLDSFQGSNVLKNEILLAVKRASDRAEFAGALLAIQMSESWRRVLTELAVDTF